MSNEYLPKPVKVLSYKRESPDCFSIRVNLKEHYWPGQFYMVSLPGIGEAPISVASFAKDHLALNIREVGNVTNALSKLKKGDTVYLRGPHGRGYPMADLHGKDLLFVGGGCGVAPLKGVLSYVEQHRSLFGDVTAFFGFRTAKDILFKEEMKKWKKIYNMNISIDKNPDQAPVDCDVCFVTDLVKDAEVFPENKIVFMCGPPMMMNITLVHLLKKGFKESQVYISEERLMNCGVGVCGHCMIRGKYSCKDGPVFRYDEVSRYKND